MKSPKDMDDFELFNNYRNYANDPIYFSQLKTEIEVRELNVKIRMNQLNEEFIKESKQNLKNSIRVSRSMLILSKRMYIIAIIQCICCIIQIVLVFFQTTRENYIEKLCFKLFRILNSLI